MAPRTGTAYSNSEYILLGYVIERASGQPAPVAVSARLPSNASTISGNPVASVNKPTVICGSSRRSLENPGSPNPSPASV